MRVATLRSFSSELEKLAVDVDHLYRRVFSPQHGKVTQDLIPFPSSVPTNFANRVNQLFAPTTGFGGFNRASRKAAQSRLRSPWVGPVGEAPAPLPAAAPRAPAASVASRPPVPGFSMPDGQTYAHPGVAGRMIPASVGMPAVNAEGRRAIGAVVGAHELSERQVAPRNMVRGFHSHASPEVLLKEHNTLSRLTGEGAEAARTSMRALRAQTGEAAHMRNLVTTAFNDPRAANYLNEGEKVPKAMRKALLRKVRQDPSILRTSAPSFTPPPAPTGFAAMRSRGAGMLQNFRMGTTKAGIWGRALLGKL